MNTKIIQTCAWCSKDMGEKNGEGITGVSHGICPECRDKNFPGVKSGGSK